MNIAIKEINFKLIYEIVFCMVSAIAGLLAAYKACEALRMPFALAMVGFSLFMLSQTPGSPIKDYSKDCVGKIEQIALIVLFTFLTYAGVWTMISYAVNGAFGSATIQDIQNANACVKSKVAVTQTTISPNQLQVMKRECEDAVLSDAVLQQRAAAKK